MKKTGIAILVALFGGISLTMAQQGRQGQGNPEIRKYFDEQILPVVEAEQQNFYKALTADEMKKIEKLKDQLDAQIAERQKRMRSGGKNKGIPQKGRTVFQAFFDEASMIAEAHSNEKKHFQKTMDANKDKWMEDIVAIREETSPGGGRDRFAQGGPMFEHFSDPAWLLLWNKDRRNFHQMARMGMHGQGMHGKGMGNGQGAHRNVNPKLRAAIREYARENIIPVITKEREAFDSYLNAEEKEQIALAQGKRKARRIMFMEWYKSEDFEPGARRDDPNFDMMREDMQKSMDEVRAIAAAHSTEIQDAMKAIKTHSQEWKREIGTIADSYKGDQNSNFKAFPGHLRRMTSPVRFLLFDPIEAGNTALFDIDRNEMVAVVVFPNPATSHATVRITGLNDPTTEVKLYTKEGRLIKSLFNEQVIGTEIAFGFSVADLENDIYIVKVKAGDIVIARKIVVRK